MIIIRRRLLLWLIRAYIKRWGKSILAFFFIGLVFFFVLLKFGTVFINKIPFAQDEAIGIVGEYTLDTLPPFIFSDLSKGLTQVGNDGFPKPDVASDWEISNNGRTYTFHLKKNIYFSDGTPLTSKLINLSFAQVSVKKPDSYSIVFNLKDAYSPFLITVTKPIFKDGLIGVGEYKIKDVRINGNFVEKLSLVSIKNVYRTKSYRFYPTQESLKYAYVFGEVNKAESLSNTTFSNTSFSSFVNTEVKKNIDYSRLVTIFYNTKDEVFSDTKVRNGLTYALPDEFSFGKRNSSPLSYVSWAYTEGASQRSQDIEKAQQLVEDSVSATKSGSLKITMKTFPQYKAVAEQIASFWKKINVDTTIEIVDTIPSQFQVFLGDFRIPKDPDQYTLWHKDQDNNITRYMNLRIDKLLEDGRKTVDIEQRKKIYADFQKYLLADSPAAFLYFPYEYEIVRK